MPKNTRRVTFTRTVTFTATIDTPGRPEETDANMLTALGGATGTFGPLSIAELLAGSAANNGVLTRGNWSATGTSLNVEPYTTRPASAGLSLGQRIASISPPSGYEAARNKLYVVSVAGTTGAGTTEPNWSLTDGGTTTDGTVTYRTIPKFPTIVNFAISSAVALGAIIRPTSTSLKEYLVTTAGTTAGSAPTWTSNDAVGASITSNTAVLLCIAGVTLYGFNQVFGLGEVVKPLAASSAEFICTAAGTSDTNALDTGSPAVGASVTRGTATFKRLT